MEKARQPPASLVAREFQLLDTHLDGKLTKENLSAALQRSMTRRSANREADKIIEKYSQADNDFLSLDEFAEFVDARYPELQAIFYSLDHNRDGRISIEDVKQGLKEAAVPHIESHVERVMLKLGGVAFDEGVTFAQFFEAAILLPSLTSRELLSSLSGVVPFRPPPPGTTPAMIVTAGIINGVVSRTMTAPMDRLRAVLATGRAETVASAARGILKAQGLRGFWSSNMANVIQVGPENGIAFLLNDQLRDHMCRDPSRPSVFEKFCMGSTAGAVAMTAVYPMYVVQNRMAAAVAGQYSGLFDCMQRTGFSFAGYGTALVRVLPMKGIMLGGYGILKDVVKDPSTGHISTGASLGCSAFAGGLAHVATYPLHVARTVLQQEIRPGDRVYSGFVDVLRHRYATHGLRGWYLGLPIWLCNRIPAVAIEFAVNERALDTLKRCNILP